MPNQNAYYSYSPADVAVSLDDYNEMLKVFEEKYLSQEMQYKFKMLFRVNSFSYITAPTVAFPFALLCSRFILGPSIRRGGNFRYYALLMSFFWPLTSSYFFLTPSPRRLYTEILADNTIDGTYIRQTLKTQRPKLWGVISRQLYEKGFNFPELNESTEATQFPSDGVQNTLKLY